MDLTHTLDDCLQRLASGQGRTEVLALYPEQADNLAPMLEKVLAGNACVTAPFASRLMIPDAQGVSRAGVPVILVLAPLRDAQQRVIAAIGLRLPPERGFSEILSVARSGESGETLAFNRQGLLVSKVRCMSMTCGAYR